MAQNIRDFYRVAQDKDFARIFQFRVTQIGTTVLTERDLVYLETASLPGRTVNNVQVPYMGLQFNVPGTASYPGSNGYAVTFRCDAGYDLRSKLEQELFRTFNDDTSTGDYSIPGPESILQLELFTGGSSFELSPTTVRLYRLYGVYVQALADTQYDIKDNGSLSMINATLCYQYWRAFNVNPNADQGVDPVVPRTVTNIERR
jgi:hypothetical protein